MLIWIFKILAIIITAPMFASIIYLLFSPILSKFNDKVKNIVAIIFLILSICLCIDMIINPTEQLMHCGYVGLWGYECSE